MPQLLKGQPSNFVSVPSSNNIENLGESSMADASPRTDISTDDTDEKNQRVNLLFFLFSILSGGSRKLVKNTSQNTTVVPRCKFDLLF